MAAPILATSAFPTGQREPRNRLCPGDPRDSKGRCRPPFASSRAISRSTVASGYIERSRGSRLNSTTPRRLETSAHTGNYGRKLPCRLETSVSGNKTIHAIPERTSLECCVPADITPKLPLAASRPPAKRQTAKTAQSARPFAAGETVMVGFLVGALTGNDCDATQVGPDRWALHGGLGPKLRSTTPATPTAVSVSMTGRPSTSWPASRSALGRS